MKQRIAYVDAAKGLSILMIAMGHITKISNPLDMWMSSFKVSIFYIISGYLMAYSGSITSRNFKEFIQKLLKSLVVPYVSFSIIGIIFKTGCVFLKHKPAIQVHDTFMEYLYDSIFLKGINSMWFLPTIFLGEIIFFWIIRSPKVIKAVYAVLGLFGITFGNKIFDLVGGIESLQAHPDTADNILRLASAVSKGIMAAWFIGAGYLIYFYYRKISDVYVKTGIGVSFTVINIILSQINSSVDIILLDEGKYPPLFYVCGIVGSVGAIALLDVISGFRELTFLDYWGKNSLIVMCTHTVLGFRTIVYNGWKSVAYIPKIGNFEYICECLVVLAILLLIEYSIVEIVNSKLPFLIGRKNKKQKGVQ
ncbi:MAG: acyltransferase family protein [Lachnospiraceae bacterium]|nr:acyltransferase family protein [Lachnospiraceae bacterium]